MKVLELFAGTRSIGNAFEARGHSVFSVDWDESFPGLSYCGDIQELTASFILDRFGRPDVIWASPDCSTYSILCISKHRHKEGFAPKTEKAARCDATNIHVLELIKELSPSLYFIENPRGALSKMHFMQGIPKYLVTYCQYGDNRQKPTHIFTNHPNPGFLPPCKNGALCHDAAPRGSQTGTLGRKNAKERARIPAALCNHIVSLCENGI